AFLAGLEVGNANATRIAISEAATIFEPQAALAEKARGRAARYHGQTSMARSATRRSSDRPAPLATWTDIPCANAGVYEFGSLDEVTEEHFHRQFNVNVLGLILATQQAARHFGPEGGSIINIGSVTGTSAPPTTSVYSATKAAVNAVTRSLASELGPRGVWERPTMTKLTAVSKRTAPL
ncbi:MAG: SDR family oxidoreductase, partial [Terrimicrobiaceae bacterium]